MGGGILAPQGRPKLEEVLRREPALLEGLDPISAEAAARVGVAEVLTLPAGCRDLEVRVEGSGALLGLLVLEGFVLREVGADGGAAAGLLGCGDLFRPGAVPRNAALAPVEAPLNALTAVEVAVLDRRFAAATSRWPEIAAALIQRALDQERESACMLAIARLPRLDDRLRSLLGHLAERWGRVRPDGVALDLPLTHDVLGSLVAARRPSVSRTLAELERDGEVTRDGETWLLKTAATSRGRSPRGARFPRA